MSKKNKFIIAYNKYSDPIYRYCYFRVYSKQIAEELMQETFMRLWKYLHQGLKVDNTQALLYQIARNLIIDLSRKKKVRQKIEDTIYSDSSYLEPSYDGKADIEKKTLLKEVYEMMKNLSFESQDILIMRFIEGMKPKEIAEIFHTSPNNVSVRIYKAIKKMNKYL